MAETFIVDDTSLYWDNLSLFLDYMMKAESLGETFCADEADSEKPPEKIPDSDTFIFLTLFGLFRETLAVAATLGLDIVTILDIDWFTSEKFGELCASLQCSFCDNKRLDLLANSDRDFVNFLLSPCADSVREDFSSHLREELFFYFLPFDQEDGFPFSKVLPFDTPLEMRFVSYMRSLRYYHAQCLKPHFTVSFHDTEDFLHFCYLYGCMSALFWFLPSADVLEPYLGMLSDFKRFAEDNGIEIDGLSLCSD